MLSTAAVAALETAINQYLALDPDTIDRLARLEGKVIAIEWPAVGLSLYFLPNASGLQVMSRYEGEPDTQLSGSPFALAQMGLGDDKEDALFSGAVTIHGDTETGQDFQAALEAMDVDWEEHLSRIIGDVAAHQAGNLARDAKQYAEKTTQTLNADIAEYLKEEAQLLPARIQVDNFLADMDTLRMDVDRLEARVQRLLKNLNRDDPAA